jgi:cytochrome c556
MKTTIISALFLGALSVSAFAGPLDDAVKARQDCMKANGASMATYVPIMKGEAAFDAAKVKAALDATAAACAGWATAFPEGSAMGETLKGYTKPEAWTDKAGFEAANKAYMDAIMKVAAATDDASFKAAFPMLGASCGACHDKYRAPKE